MKQLVQLLVIAAVISILILGGYYAYFVVPEDIEKTFTKSLQDSGFKNVAFTSTTKGNGKIIFSGVTLDKDSFSKMNRAELSYSLFDYIFYNRQASKLLIEELRLTGTLDEDLNLKISGQDNTENLLAALHQIPVKSIEFKNSSIDILSAKYGGLKIDYNALLRRQSKKIDLSAAIISAQQQLIIKGKANGTLFPEGKADINLDIQELQITQENYRLNRANAKGNFTYITGKPITVSLDISAGGANFYTMPFQNVDIKYMSSGTNYKIETKGKTTGTQAMDFSSTLHNMQNENSFHGKLMAIKAQDIVDYLVYNKIMPDSDALPDYITDLNSTELSFSMESLLTENVYNGAFTFMAKQPSFDVAGRFELDKTNKTLRGTFAMPQTAREVKSKKNKDVTLKFDLSSVGAFKLENWKKKDNKFAWSFSLQPQNGEIAFGPLRLDNIKGNLEYTSEKIKNTQFLGFNLPLKRDINQRGKIGIDFSKEQSKALDSIYLTIYGGTIQTNNLTLEDNALPEQLTINLSDINLSDFIKDANLGNGFDIAGQIGGKLPLVVKGGKIHVKNGLLQSQSSGLVSLSKDLRDGLFPGNTAQMKNIRESLDNFFYEYFEIRLDGNFSESVMMTLNARGHNPDMPDKEPIDLSLQIETDLSDLFNQLTTH